MEKSNLITKVLGLMNIGMGYQQQVLINNRENIQFSRKEVKLKNLFTYVERPEIFVIST